MHTIKFNKIYILSVRRLFKDPLKIEVRTTPLDPQPVSDINQVSIQTISDSRVCWQIFGDANYQRWFLAPKKNGRVRIRTSNPHGGNRPRYQLCAMTGHVNMI